MTPHFHVGELFEALHAGGVEYLVIGGVAVQIHGHPRATGDLDIVLRIDQSNLQRAALVLRNLEATIRGVNAASRADVTDPQWLGVGANFTLTTTSGNLDVFTGLVPGGAPYGELMERAMLVDFDGIPVRVVGLDDLISMKRAAGRERDIKDIAALTEPGPG